MTVHKGAVWVVGIDPGPMVGIVGLYLTPATNHVAVPWQLNVVQCDPGSLESILDGLYRSYRFAVLLAVERFVVGPRAARSSTPAAGRVARDMAEFCVRWAVREDVPCVERTAADVKPWASEARLDAAGLLVPTKGMRHARDAARHALYAAVKDCGVADPLSKRGT